MEKNKLSLKKFNWIDDDGINLPMINDVPRNQFYDKILAQETKNKKCCDIGFGTGILSLLALKHGAKHIIAYEKDGNRFELGKWIIKKLGLENKIELRNNLAQWEQIDQDKCDVVFHEIIHQELWGEGVWYIRPQTPSIRYVPGILFFELYAQEISDFTVSGFLSGIEQEYFNPGVEITVEFIDLINGFICQNSSDKLQKLDVEDHLFRTQWHLIHKDWSWSPKKVFSQSNKKLLAKYQVDYNLCTVTYQDSNGTRTDNLSNSKCELVIDTQSWRCKNMLLEPRFGLEHNGHRLLLSDCRNWGEEPLWVFVRPKSNLHVRQDFSSQKFPFNIIKI